MTVIEDQIGLFGWNVSPENAINSELKKVRLIPEVVFDIG
jgi:hypothetical protein